MVHSYGIGYLVRGAGSSDALFMSVQYAALFCWDCSADRTLESLA